MSNIKKIVSTIILALSAGAIIFWLEKKPKSKLIFQDNSLGALVDGKCNLNKINNLDNEDLINFAILCRDLYAQDSMATSTQFILWTSWVQILAALAGTIAVLWTISLSFKSIKLSQEALRHQQLSTTLQLRPYCESLDPTIKYDPQGKSRVSILFRNNGNSTARNLRFNMIWEFTEISKGQHNLKNHELRVFGDSHHKARDGKFGRHINLNPRITAGIKNGIMSLKIAFLCTYDDHFNNKYYFTYTRELYGQNLETSHSLLNFKFDDPEIKGREV